MSGNRRIRRCTSQRGGGVSNGCSHASVGPQRSVRWTPNRLQPGAGRRGFPPKARRLGGSGAPRAPRSSRWAGAERGERTSRGPLGACRPRSAAKAHGPAPRGHEPRVALRRGDRPERLGETGDRSFADVETTPPGRARSRRSRGCFDGSQRDDAGTTASAGSTGAGQRVGCGLGRALAMQSVKARRFGDEAVAHGSGGNGKRAAGRGDAVRLWVRGILRGVWHQRGRRRVAAALRGGRAGKPETR